MSAEWIPGTIDPANGLTRGDVPRSWVRKIPQEEGVFSEERHRSLLVELAKEGGSQAFADFISELYSLKNPIILPK